MPPNRPKPRGFLLLLLGGMIAACLPALCERLRLREYDVQSIMIQVRVIYGLVYFCIVVLPISLFLLFLIRWRPLHPLMRTLIVVSPAIIWNLPALSEAVFSPVSASGDFAKRLKHPLPPTTNGLLSWCCHGRDSSYMFSFSTTSEATKALLSSGNFKLLEYDLSDDHDVGSEFRLPVGGGHLPKSWPDPRSWEGLELYGSETIEDYGFIFTDKWHSKVLVLVGDT